MEYAGQHQRPERQQMGTKADDDGTFFMVKKNNLSNQVKTRTSSRVETRQQGANHWLHSVTRKPRSQTLPENI